MQDKSHILKLIKASVLDIEPSATVILYGSYARRDDRGDSDIDILVLVDKEKLTFEDKKKIQYPLYDIEFETGIIISPILYSRAVWETKYRIIPFYENVKTDGKLL